MAIGDVTKLHAPEPVRHTKPPAGPEALEHMQLREGEFWREIPAYQNVDEPTFLDHGWQYRNSVKTVDELANTVQGLVTPQFLEDLRTGFHRAPMNVRVSPYAIALIDWRIHTTTRSAPSSSRSPRVCCRTIPN
ncbi:MAG TPA: hypothetical protein VEJ20_03660 [Candidatus Eremiobacteraceae bacterium]|nr:hypothetical protein [Candidatus Eremiobacteraceae bacterium]